MLNSIDDILEKHLPNNELNEINRILYGDGKNLRELGSEINNEYDIKKFRFECSDSGDEYKPRIVKVAAIQHSIVLPTNAPIYEQKSKIFTKVKEMIDKAAELGANIICLPETWNMPFGLNTREKLPWCEFAEDCESGPSTILMKQLAEQYKLVIISPILERDTNHGDLMWNTAVILSERGQILGKQRKNHIPSNGESEYYIHGSSRCQVFDTIYGKIGVTICFDRHHPLNWMMYAINGAEIVFNPAATYANEHWWSIEARSAAFDHHFYTVALNRIGFEKFHLESGLDKVYGLYFGSSYISAPDGSRTKSLSRVRDGILYVEMDLNLCEQMRQALGFHQSQRLSYYKDSWSTAADLSFIPQIISQNK